MNISSQKSILLQWTAIDQEDVQILCDRISDLCIYLIASSFIWLACNDYDLLKLILLKVPCSEWFDETLNGGMDSANDNMVLDIRVVFQRSKRNLHGLRWILTDVVIVY